MKKFKLKAQELGATEVLTRSQLKNVLGGLAAVPTTKCFDTTHCWTCCKAQGHDQQWCDSYCG